MFDPKETLPKTSDNCIPAQIIDLYRPYQTSFYYEKVDPNRTINQNHRRATADIVSLFREAQTEGRPRVAALFGPMASGKAVVECEIGEVFPHQAFQHVLDKERGHGFITNSNGDGSLKMTATLFERVGEIMSQIDPEKLLIIDEVEFAKNTPEEISAFFDELRLRRVNALLGGLDLDFRREPWATTGPIIRFADKVFVLAAACTEPGCGAPSSFTQRTIDGEPAHYDDPLIMVGSVKEGYTTKCGLHYRLKPPRNGNLRP